MFRGLYLSISLATIALHATTVFAQASSSEAVARPCDKTCRQQELDAAFRAMDEAETSRHPKPSDTADCTAYEGHDHPDVFLDVCAKLKYVRSLPFGETSSFDCPRDNAALVGRSAQRIAAAWGAPDFVENGPTPGHGTNDSQWTYFLGRAKPGWLGGGFAEVTLYLVDGIVRNVDCGLAK